MTTSVYDKPMPEPAPKQNQPDATPRPAREIEELRGELAEARAALSPDNILRTARESLGPSAAEVDPYAGIDGVLRRLEHSDETKPRAKCLARLREVLERNRLRTATAFSVLEGEKRELAAEVERLDALNLRRIDEIEALEEQLGRTS